MKTEATNLARMIEAEFGKKLTRSEALEKVAYLRGFDNWDTAVACGGMVALAPKLSPAPEAQTTVIPKNVLSSHDQISQLFMLHTATNHGFTYRAAIDLLCKQKDPRYANRWRQVSLDPKSKLPDLLDQTEMFSPNIILMAGIGSDQRIILDLIQYLKSYPHS